jgi:CheY-like chemotaxis protein
MMEQSRRRSVETLRGYVRGPRCGNRQGEEATRRLKGNPQTREIPIIALSAHAVESERETAIATGCDEFDAKRI